MNARLSVPQLSPTAFQAMLHLEEAIRGLGLEQRLVELLKIRASQVNGCAYCIDRRESFRGAFEDPNGLCQRDAVAVSSRRWERPFSFRKPRILGAGTPKVSPGMGMSKERFRSPMGKETLAVR